MSVRQMVRWLKGNVQGTYYPCLFLGGWEKPREPVMITGVLAVIRTEHLLWNTIVEPQWSLLVRVIELLVPNISEPASVSMTRGWGDYYCIRWPFGDCTCLWYVRYHLRIDTADRMRLHCLLSPWKLQIMYKSGALNARPGFSVHDFYTEVI
jgi:hypothetical protein